MPETLKISTLNCNGLRAATKKGFLDWFCTNKPDVLLLQEIRSFAMPEIFKPHSYYSIWNPAKKAGYSGVAIISKYPINNASFGFSNFSDEEGRIISCDILDINFTSVYLPSGSSGEKRQNYKDLLLVDFQKYIDEKLQNNNKVVIGGDYNIAHQKIDLKNWRGNLQNSGFLPHEREWMTKHLKNLTDLHREFLKDRAEYTWWSNRGKAFENNTGWRIDYLLAKNIRADKVWVDRWEKYPRISDHAPLNATINF